MYTLYVNSRTFFFKKLVISVMKGSKFLVHNMYGNKQKGSTTQIRPISKNTIFALEYLTVKIWLHIIYI